jgi:hypothetical protein
MTAITIADLNNAKLDVDHIAAIATSTSATSTDRLGNVKQTMAGAVGAIAAINNRGAWVTAASYLVKDIVSNSGTWYVCVVAHTSSASFASDTASKWRVYQGVTSGDLAASSGASLVGYLPAGVGGIATMQAAINNALFVSPLGWMTDAEKLLVIAGTSANDHTAAFQLAINTGKNLDLLGYSFNVGNLTQASNFQGIVSSRGVARLNKNANGPVITSTGNNVTFQNVDCRDNADSFTGHGIVSSGDNPQFINCGGYRIAGRCIKATGNHVVVDGTCNLYYTRDSAGYDIEIGVSGTATLYHQLRAVYTSQAGGGLLLTDTGSHSISGGQFGKLDILAGTSPAGVNGGTTLGARVLGNVSVGLSGAVFSGNQFSNIVVAFLAGTSNCSLDGSNVFSSGATVTNAGNSNNVIVRNTGTGAAMALRYGSETSNRTIKLDGTDATNAYEFDGSLILPNTRSLRIKDSTGAVLTGVALSSGDDWTFGSNNGANFVNIASGSGGIYMQAGGASIAQVYATGLRPQTDNLLDFGTAAQRWRTVYAGTGTINTSDERMKEQFFDLTAAEKRVAVKAKGLLKSFRFCDSVLTKGSQARIHFGIGAQSLKAAFESEGLIAENYGVFCYDEWAATPAVLDEDGGVVAQAIPAGNRYGVRYDELVCFVLGAL